MRQVLAIATALGDANRLRVLLALRQGELCLCHLIGLLELAPSTVSKHLSQLKAAGLVETRREGKWIHYRLSEAKATAAALRWVTAALAEDPQVATDAKALQHLCKQKPEELCACYRS